MTDERTRRRAEPDKTQDRTGKYGGDDGALEHEREEIQPGADSGITGTPVPSKQSESPAKQAARQQERDLETGEENPG
jgi:hypothetical protein